LIFAAASCLAAALWIARSLSAYAEALALSFARQRGPQLAELGRDHARLLDRVGEADERVRVLRLAVCRR
jgi:hypothetical protein